MTNATLSIRMRCGIVHTFKRPTDAEPWTEEYTAPGHGGQWTLRPGPSAWACMREGIDPGPGPHWLLISPCGSVWGTSLETGLRSLRHGVNVASLLREVL